MVTQYQLTMEALKVTRAVVQVAALAVFGYQLLVALGKYNDIASAVTVSSKEWMNIIQENMA